MDDVARFGANEDEALVLASLACPYCLRQAGHVLLASRSDGREAICGCETCRKRWSVALEQDQALRLLVAPPRGLRIEYQRGADGGAD